MPMLDIFQSSLDFLFCNKTDLYFHSLGYVFFIRLPDAGASFYADFCRFL